MEFSTLSPNERVVLISGASSGIGLETTKILINAGYKLSIGVRNVEKAEEIYKNYNNDHILINYEIFIHSTFLLIFCLLIEDCLFLYFLSWLDQQKNQIIYLYQICIQRPYLNYF